MRMHARASSTRKPFGQSEDLFLTPFRGMLDLLSTPFWGTPDPRVASHNVSGEERLQIHFGLTRVLGIRRRRTPSF